MKLCLSRKLCLSLLLISGAVHASQPNKKENNVKAPGLPPIWFLAVSAVPAAKLILETGSLGIAVVGAGIAMVGNMARNHPTTNTDLTTRPTIAPTIAPTTTPTIAQRGNNEKNS